MAGTLRGLLVPPTGMSSKAPSVTAPFHSGRRAAAVFPPPRDRRFWDTSNGKKKPANGALLPNSARINESGAGQKKTLPPTCGELLDLKGD